MSSEGMQFWGQLITPDQKCSPRLRQLCLGLAQVISKLDPGSEGGNELTPQRLATFYRSVGGNYDSIFLRNTTSLSLIYKTLGCYHSIQPGPSPLEFPSIPALTPLGFVTWQTLQLRLCPDEHGPYLQEAVKRYQVPTPDGGTFPKELPREALPERPDPNMVTWWTYVTGKMDHQAQQQQHRLASSPYRSQSRGEEYFPAGAVHRPRGDKYARASSQDDSGHQRRRSVPNIPPLDGPDPRSHSAHLSGSHTPRRSPNRSSQPQGHPASAYRTSKPYHKPPASPGDRHPRDSTSRSSGSRPRSPSSDASSEDSRSGRSREKKGRRNSLWPPSFLRSNSRRHSHDATYNPPERKPPLPPRNVQPKNDIPSYRQDFQSQADPTPIPLQPHISPPNTVRFRDDMFSPSTANSAPSQQSDSRQKDPHSRYRSATYNVPPPPPMNQYRLQDTPYTQQDSQFGHDVASRMNGGAPLRVQTVVGVGGRKYAKVEPLSASSRIGRQEEKPISTFSNSAGAVSS